MCARSPGGTSNTCLTCTMPTVASRSPSTTGKRENPDAAAAATRSAMVSSVCSATIFDRGVISSSAVRAPNCSERRISHAVASSSAPLRAELRTNDTSSCGVRAERSSSAGSMPSRRTIQFAAPFVRRMAGVSSSENSTWPATTERAVRSGRATARYLGTSSPKTIDSDVTITRAKNVIRPSATRSDIPTATSPGCGSSATSGSVR
ncbi:Uncharacterised protein [Mycobacterium tuberculosis]|uniref:Uncharacterized protein n=3 Tax=Mycobacterium tuberculosis TaxID=1773 RepID=A0A916LBN4_MYCTX|nr:Uncharacterised protein [Mycobacterium tuberculosis]